MKFVDEAIVRVEAGDGGNGIVRSFTVEDKESNEVFKFSITELNPSKPPDNLPPPITLQRLVTGNIISSKIGFKFF